MAAWVDKDEIIAALDLKRFGSQGWFQSKKKTPCPWCGRGGEKFGIRFNEAGNGFVCHCFYCGVKKNSYEYLKALDRIDLLKFNYEASLKTKLTELVEEKEEEKEDLKVKKVKLPMRLERLENFPYLDERRFLPFHYKEFEPSITNSILEKDLKGYIIFKLKMEGEVVAWLARSQHSYEWHKKELEEAKKEGRKPKLRYENSRTDFTKIVGGYDDITENTKVVILVEGLFDKVGIDNILDTPNDETTRCCFLFGNSISKEQIALLKLKKSIETVILCFDDGTEMQSKSAGLMLAPHFHTKIAHLTRPGVDPGDMDLEYFIEVLDRLEDPIEYYVSKIPKRW